MNMLSMDNPNSYRLAWRFFTITVRVWGAVLGDCEQTMEGHTSGVRSVAFSPDGRQIVSGSGGGSRGIRDETVRVWDVAPG
jgi:WD40 repeat protein